MDWPKLASAFAGLRLSLWLLAMGLYLGTQTVSALRWRLLAGVHGFGGSTSRYVAYYFIGMFFNLVLPTSVGGDVVRAWYLANQAEAPADARRLTAFLSVFAERLSGVLMLVGVACCSLLLCPLELPWWVSGAVIGIGLAGVGGLLALPLLRKFLASERLGARGQRLRHLVQGCFSYLGHPRLLFWTSVLSLLVQAANVVLVALVGAALGLQIEPYYYGVVVPLVTLLTLLPISVNGMGLREFGYMVLLAPAGVDGSSAVLLAFLSFAVVTGASLLGVGFYLFGRFPRFRIEPADVAGAEVRDDGCAVGGYPDQGRMRQSSTAA
jgi:uncharacterized membrane protein YbhN (UPF0104 family)